ncbi:oxidoreductase (plasmid) [Sphingobium sp. SCG-1]|nr:oxidoreductase [Sphingobium sp. SCG-1]
MTIKETGERFLQSHVDGSILRAALRAGIGFPYECSSGGCGSCRFKPVEGDFSDLSLDPGGLSERDKRKGFRLACQSSAVGDVTISVTTRREFEPKHRFNRFAARLTALRDLTPDMREFTFVGPKAAMFLPGQYAILEGPANQTRCYSMSNLPNDQGNWQFIIKRVVTGEFSNWLFGLEIGEALTIDGPVGLAHIVEASQRDVICIAGGSGLAPIISIARALASDPAHAAKQIHIFYGGRTPADLCGEGHLNEFPCWGERLRFHSVVSDQAAADAAGWTGETGFVHESVIRQFGEKVKDHEIYFAGPPPMATALQSALMLEMKVPFEQIHFDRFF